jgi:hypothetical protein
MRKVIGQLDDEQKEALLEVVNFGIAICSAALAVDLLKTFVDFLIV